MADPYASHVEVICAGRSGEWLKFYDYTFLRELPHLYAGLEDLLASKDARFADTELPSFMRMGSWIGGDRDGNPFVTATVLEKLW